MAEGYAGMQWWFSRTGGLTPEAYKSLMAHQHKAGTISTVSVVSDIGQMVQDFLLKAVQVDGISSIQELIEPFLLSEFGLALKQKAAGPTGDEASMREYLVRIYKGLFENWKAGIWRGVGTGYMGALEQFLQSGQILYAYKTLAYNLAVMPRMQRRWNRAYTPMVPDANMAWQLWRKGVWASDKWVDHASYDGWDEAGAGLLNNLFTMYPSVLQGFDWWRRGFIGRPDRDRIYFGQGWDPEYHERVTDDLYHVPSSYELVRMADFVEIDQTWAIKQLKRARMKDEDIAKLWQMIELRPLREEVRGITSKYLWRYRMGRCLIEDLDAALILTGIKRKERELLTLKAELDYEDELIDEWVEILRWRFRTAVITDQEFLKGLIDLGIREEKANLMVELEKAMGYMGYY